MRRNLERLVSGAMKILLDLGRTDRRALENVKGRGDVATEADLTAEAFLIEGLEREFPGVPILAEESGVRGDGTPSDEVFVIDPLDGTSNFYRGLRHHAVSLALVKAGMPICAACAVGEPVEIYSARKGQGASCDGVKIATRQEVPEGLGMVGLQSAFSDVPPPYVPWCFRHAGKVRILGSAVSQICFIAAGRMDLTILKRPKAWDIAGAGLVLSEAGGLMFDFSGVPRFPLPEDFTDHPGRGYPLIASGGWAHERIPFELFRKR